MLFLNCLLAFGLCFVTVPTVIRLSWRIGAVDVPRDHRRMHKESIPRGGGMAIFASFFVACLSAGIESRLLNAALFGAFLVFAVGLIDDICSLSAYTKLLVELFAASAAVLWAGIAPGWGSLASVLWVVTLTNAHNFIDGLDGLLAGCTVIQGSLLALTFWLGGRAELAMAPLLLSSACLAFRHYNRAPARIFAGDCGSGSIGFLLGMLSLPLFGDFTPQLSSMAPLLLFAYPLTDLVTSAVRRVMRGKSPFAADRAHLHHRISAVGLTHAQSGRVLLLLSGAVGTVGVLIGDMAHPIYAAAASLAAAVVLMLSRHYILSFA